ncbi:transglycosylase domain-containing protein [Patescibacteria group bacterium]|nr:transglycosylase domain-containing protein [Patescibacteria group bacterium]
MPPRKKIFAAKPFPLLPKPSGAGGIRRFFRQSRIYLFWLLPIAMIAFSYLTIFKDLPSPTKLGAYDIPISTKIYDRNGTLLYDIYANQNRSTVPLSQIPGYVRDATISIEDKNFYTHGGINPIGGMLRAMVATVTGGQLQGGSTITQQLVKSALLTPERTITRKIKEIILASWVELLYPKDKILEMYLNQVPYGGTAWGVETAAEKYFGKPIRDVDLAQAALLAGLPQAPTLYSPFGAHPELAKERQKEVLTRMTEDGYITKAQADAAFAENLEYKQTENIKAPHFVMYVKEQLVDRYGERMVEQGGLKVTTTLDEQLQEYAQATVASEIAKLKGLHVGNGAALVTRPATGEILAMVGSADYFATPSGSFNVTTALRQPGSSIKPINYAIGIDKHIVTPATMFLDVPTCFANINQPGYCPHNYDAKFHGPVQLRFALGNSFNIPAVKMLYLNTVRDMVASASAFGITTFTDPSRYGLSLTLGGGDVHMTDMATAFGVFANGGVRKNLVSILKVTDKNGKVLEEYKDPNLGRDIPSQLLISGPRVLSPETAFLLSHILLDNNARSEEFGTDSSLVIRGHPAVSVKTGTTNDLRDNWTIGFTPQFLVATWVGNDDNSPMNQSLVSGITGAAPIWNKLMSKVLEGRPDIWPNKPDGIVGAQICAVSGLLPPNPDPNAGDKGCPTRFEYFIKGTVPTERETLARPVLIDKTTGDIAPPGKTDNVETETHQVLTDPTGAQWCLDCPHPPDEQPQVLK